MSEKCFVRTPGPGGVPFPVPGHAGRVPGCAGVDERAWRAGWGGVEGTGSYGAGLARYLAARGVAVVEVIRPSRQARRRRGKSDTADAVAAALLP